MRIFAIILVLLLQFQLLVITTNCSNLEMQEEHNHMKVVENKQVYIAALRKIGGRGITGTHASRGGHGLGEGASTPKDEVATVGGLRNSKFVDVDVDVKAAGAGIAAAEEAAIAAGEGAAAAAAGEAAEGAAAAAAGEAAEGAHTAANTAAATAAAATASVASEARSISPNAPFGLTLCLVLASSGLLLLPEF